jgi:type II secretory pathway component PulJ
MVEELQADKNQFYRLLQGFRKESRAVSIAIIALIVSLLSLLMSYMSAQNAMEANIRSELQTQRIEELADKIEVMKVYLSNHKEDHHE